MSDARVGITIPQSLCDSPPYLPPASNVLGNAEDNLHTGAVGRELTRQLIFVLFGMCAISVASLGSMGVALAVGERADALFHNGRGYGRIVWARLIFDEA